jgi:hypothetical protein
MSPVVRQGSRAEKSSILFGMLLWCPFLQRERRTSALACYVNWICVLQSDLQARTSQVDCPTLLEAKRIRDFPALLTICSKVLLQGSASVVFTDRRNPNGLGERGDEGHGIPRRDGIAYQ